MLTTNALLCEICAAFPKQLPDWDKVAERFKKSSMFFRQGYESGQLFGRLVELYVRATLEKLTAAHSPRVIINPIQDGTRIRGTGYTYYVDNPGIRVRKHNQDCCEIDDFLIIDRLPVLVEVKAGESQSGSIRDVVSTERVTKLRDVFKPLFGTNNFAYILFMPKERVDGWFAEQDSVLQTEPLQICARPEDARQNCILLVPLYTTRKRLLTELIAVEEKYKLLG